ncbi:MAG TPA: serine/threonine-protein kinase, partial [Gemmatimonadales bacterium]|nr:serine/threonine-protein kinase [Gemmatimonadales bacterium]
MEPEWNKVKELFWAALERAPDQRDGFLREACGTNHSLLTEVEALLAANDQPASVLQRPLSIPDTPLLPFTAIPGVRLGAYEIVGEIGHGGMATVYLAVRADGQYRKRVAIKVVRHHADADEILRRFRTERQALAALDHPNIVKLLDGGSTEEGLPYLVMDYVEGLPVDRYCDRHSLSVIERLDLFRSICAAVQYAHEQLVIHRDLKPGNILVSAEGTPKLLDFGIAKVLNPEFSAETLVVTRGDVHPMTPLYASPEQVRGGHITAATDIYSLGVVLFELLTGHHLYPLTIGTPVELEHVICDSEPQRPSRVVDRLQRQLHGDLDHIVLKALRKEPHQRYRSVAELSDDIGRHLAGMPVTARRGTLRYRAGKFVRRHKTEVGAAGLLVMVAIGGAIAVHRYGLALEQQRWATAAGSRPQTATSPAPTMLAVLPFENLGRSEDEYVADGITDEVRDKLIALPGLQVIARSSSGQYKTTQKPAIQIGRELGVQYLLTATVRWEAGLPGARRVRVSAELIDVASGTAPTTKWAEPFDASWSNLFQVQTDIALRVARALGVALGAGARQQLAERPTRNLAAYEAFLRAEAAKQASDPVALRRALPYYEQAVALDSGFVLAWEQLARAHSIMYANGMPSPADAEAARNAADRALALAPNRPEGHLARGLYYGAVVGDHARALEEYAEASRLAPGDAQPLFPMATDEMSLGRWDAALDHLRRAER